jgi:hypothetical protein
MTADRAINAQIDATGTATAFTGEAMTNTTGRFYQITDATKRVWDPSASFVIYDNAVPVSAANLKFNYLFGTVEILVGHGAISGPVTSDGDYLPILEIATANKFTNNVTRDVPVATPFHASDTHKKKVVGLADASGTISHLDFSQEDIDPGGGTLTIGDLLEGTDFVLTIEYGDTALVFRAFARFDEDSIKSSVNDLVTADTNWKSVPQQNSDGENVAAFTWDDLNPW